MKVVDYDLLVTGFQEIKVPFDSTILSVGVVGSHNTPVLRVLVGDRSAPEGKSNRWKLGVTITESDKDFQVDIKPQTLKYLGTFTTGYASSEVHFHAFTDNNLIEIKK